MDNGNINVNNMKRKNNNNSKAANNKKGKVTVTESITKTCIKRLIKLNKKITLYKPLYLFRASCVHEIYRLCAARRSTRNLGRDKGKVVLLDNINKIIFKLRLKGSCSIFTIFTSANFCVW